MPKQPALSIAPTEEFAQKPAGVIRRFLRLKAWRDTQRIVIGGGLHASRVGELNLRKAPDLSKAHVMDFAL